MRKIDVYAHMSPQMLAVMQKESELAGDANDTSVGFREMRQNYVLGRAWWNEGGPKMSSIRSLSVPTPFGTVACRLYLPIGPGEGPLPTIVYAHGGGFVLGNLDTHDRICRILASESQMAVMAVDYTLSPEAKCPQAIREVAAVAKRVHEKGAEMGLDGNRMAFAGDSGGAHLSLAAKVWLEQEEGDASFIKALLLFYGWFGLGDSSSWRLLGGPWDGLAEADWKFYRELYLEPGTDEQAHPYVNLLANPLEELLPPSYIACCKLDPLHDDSLCLAVMAEEAGIPHRFEEFPGVLHGFLHYSKMLDASHEALGHAAEFAREHI